MQFILVMAVIVIASVINDDNIDNVTAIANIYYIIIFVFGKCIICIFEYIAYCLLAPMMKDNNDIDNNNDKEEMEEMKEEL